MPAPVAIPVAPQPTNYGNMPLEVSQSGSTPSGGGNKFGAHGKKFGKKLGNAGLYSCPWNIYRRDLTDVFLAIFGAGATMGADLVNSIF